MSIKIDGANALCCLDKAVACMPELAGFMCTVTPDTMSYRYRGGPLLQQAKEGHTAGYAARDNMNF